MRRTNGQGSRGDLRGSGWRCPLTPTGGGPCEEKSRKIFARATYSSHAPLILRTRHGSCEECRWAGRSVLTSNTLLKLGAELASSAQAVHAGVSVAVVPPVALDGREVGRTPRLITVLWRLLSGAWLFLDVRLHYLTNNYYFPIRN